MASSNNLSFYRDMFEHSALGPLCLDPQSSGSDLDVDSSSKSRSIPGAPKAEAAPVAEPTTASPSGR
jgi:hypothetical protein